VSSEENLRPLWLEIIESIESITDEEIIDNFNNQKRKAKSISESLNQIIKDKLLAKGWKPESPIFNNRDYEKSRYWRLDFAKGLISVEVAFNHSEAIAWNLIKPVLASELNHVKKAIQTRVGVIICATDDLKQNGGFDGAVGTFEKYIQYLKPLNNILSVPIVIVGLKPFQTFFVEVLEQGGKKYGNIKYLDKIWE
jgi:hypothetical protein